ncbi:hypothetical protein F503_03400 [Ophiostoma piceae UAMH 11346]|uniref:Uncharacterized protein n=1 Tax=Ophiostoma piceae (strain UAMH 11346) TaxID=1262450 RepID=S3CKH3_OPHP1|nr:hypothetical protein F503_03400 [Ophiostoma piceae UAMH 11346]
MPSRILTLAALMAAAVSANPVSAATSPEIASFGPSIKVAADRGNQIFNSVFDSLRKYGSAVHPNGMSLYLATVPQGVLFHHGNGRNATPTSLDWLAYEIEHAEMFARTKFGGGHPPPGGPGSGPPHVAGIHEEPPFPGPPGPPKNFPTGVHPPHGPPHGPNEDPHGPSPHHQSDSRSPSPPSHEKAFFGESASQVALGDEKTTEEEGHGWLHIYRTTRPLHFLYIDGMSGDKGSDGVIDTQDYLLRAVTPEQAAVKAKAAKTKAAAPTTPSKPPGPPGEFARAEDLCELCAEWGLQGVIRTEGAGTEIIKCDFSDGLEEVQSLQRSDNGGGGFPGGPGGGNGRRPGGGFPGGPRPGGPGGPPHIPSGPFDVENGFRDVGGHRTVLDYASMVSAFFFPVNLTNPEAGRAAFPRLTSASNDELVAIKTYLHNIVEARRDAPLSVYSWRDVADLIVRRYQPRLVSLANSTAASFEDEVQSVLNVFTDYSVTDAAQRDAEGRARCTAFYLQTKTPLETETDELLYAAFEGVTGKICNVLYDTANTVAGSTDEKVVASARNSIKNLIAYLDWSVFERKF